MSLTDEEHEELVEVLQKINEVKSAMNPREREFVEQQQLTYDEHGAAMRLSPRQWEWLKSISEKYNG